jgi:hypothetical protein
MAMTRGAKDLAAIARAAMLLITGEKVRLTRDVMQPPFY